MDKGKNSVLNIKKVELLMKPEKGASMKWLNEESGVGMSTLGNSCLNFTPTQMYLH
jgi:hypothetical protein